MMEISWLLSLKLQKFNAGFDMGDVLTRIDLI